MDFTVPACHVLYRGRQDGLMVVFSLCEYEAIVSIQRLAKHVENDLFILSFLSL